MPNIEERAVQIASHGRLLEADLRIPASPRGVVVFAHGSGSSRKSSRNRFVADALNRAGFCTLLLDLLTADEEYAERWSRHLRFDIQLLASRLISARRWASIDDSIGGLPIGYFGSSTGAAAALVAAAQEPSSIAAVVSRGGRPDLAGDALSLVYAPTLLLVGGDDHGVIELNEGAYQALMCEKALRVIPGASHLFEEPGTLEEVARMAAEWFALYLRHEAQPGLQP